MVRRRFKWFAVVGLAVLVCAASAAHAVTMDTLDGTTASNSITCGDKLFDEFTYLATGDMPADTGVNVVCSLFNGNNGLQFQGGFTDLIGGGTSDALITYTVTVLDPNFTITGAHLSGNPAVVGGTGAMTVTETFLPDAANIMSIFDVVPGATQLTDSTVFGGPGFTTLHVQKDILGAAGTGVATLSFVNQNFSQTSSVPEPGTLGLLGIGLLGVAGYAWRRRC